MNRRIRHGRHANRLENPVDVVHQEVGILVVAQNRHVKHNGDREKQASRRATTYRDLKAQPMVNKNRDQQYDDIARFSPCVEKQAEQQQNRVPRDCLACRPVTKQDERQKQEKKNRLFIFMNKMVKFTAKLLN